MFLTAVSFAKSKSKNILVKMISQAGTGYTFNAKRNRLREKLTLLHFDPIESSKEQLKKADFQSLTSLLNQNSGGVNKKVLFVEQKKIRSL